MDHLLSSRMRDSMDKQLFFEGHGTKSARINKNRTNSKQAKFGMQKGKNKQK